MTCEKLPGDIEIGSRVEVDEAGSDMFAEDTDGFVNLVALGGGKRPGRGVAELGGEIGQFNDRKRQWGQGLAQYLGSFAQGANIPGEFMPLAVSEDQHFQKLLDGLLSMEAEDAAVSIVDLFGKDTPRVHWHLNFGRKGRRLEDAGEFVPSLAWKPCTHRQKWRKR